MARVTRPAGLVKMTGRKPGDSLRAAPQIRATAGMVRVANANPAGPVVSCPMTPRSMQALSSAARRSSKPGLIVIMSASHPSTASSREDAILNGGGFPRWRHSARPTGIRALMRSGLMSNSVTRSIRLPAPDIDAIISGSRVEPAPAMQTFIA